jgi:hypothetical protein
MKIHYLLICLSGLLLMQACAQQGECQPQGKYLIVRPYAGLSNRLRVLASAKIMAALTDRHLVVVWDIVPNETPGRWKDFFLNPMTSFGQSPLPREGCTLKRVTEAPPNDPIIKNLGDQNNGKTSPEILSSIPDYPEPIVFFGTSITFAPETEIMPTKEYKKR